MFGKQEGYPSEHSRDESASRDEQRARAGMVMVADESRGGGRKREERGPGQGRSRLAGHANFGPFTVIFNISCRIFPLSLLSWIPSPAHNVSFIL